MREAVNGALGKGKEFEKERKLKDKTEDFISKHEQMSEERASALFWSAPQPSLPVTLQFHQDKSQSSILEELFKALPWPLGY